MKLLWTSKIVKPKVHHGSKHGFQDIAVSQLSIHFFRFLPFLFYNYLQNELLWQNLFLALSFISVRPQEDLRCPALNEEVVHSKVAKTSNTNRLCQLSSWKRQATQTHCVNCRLSGWQRQTTQTHCFDCQFSSWQIQATQTHCLCQLSRWRGRQTTSQNLNEDLKR